LLFRDMQRDAVLQLLRRVQALRPSSSFDAG
jgi:outer membrane lipopolysaccharide assembly protein LptE/RlpB